MSPERNLLTEVRMGSNQAQADLSMQDGIKFPRAIEGDVVLKIK